MIQANIVDELSPPKEYKADEGVEGAIVRAVMDRCISYPAEIVADTGLSRQTVFDKIRIMKNQGFLERVFLKQFVPDLLKSRLQELWDMGLKGNMIKRMSWYTVTVKGSDYYGFKKDTELKKS